MKTIALFFISIMSLQHVYSQKSHKVNVVHLKQYEEDKKTGHSIYFADYDASRRGSIILHDMENIKNPVRILSEPPPDAIIAFTTALQNSLSIDGKINTNQSAHFSQAVSELTKRNTTVVVLRDALYRLNEFNFNNPQLLTKEDYLSKFQEILNLAGKLADNEKQQIKNDSLKISKENNSFSTEIPIYFQITDEKLRSSTNKIVSQLNVQGYNASGTELVDIKIKSNMIKYFDDSDLKNAKELKNDLEINGVKNIELIKASNPKKYKNRFEVWLKE